MKMNKRGGGEEVQQIKVHREHFQQLKVSPLRERNTQQ